MSALTYTFIAATDQYLAYLLGFSQSRDTTYIVGTCARTRGRGYLHQGPRLVVAQGQGWIACGRIS